MAPPVIHPADRISRLPVETQAHILSFLPALEAVRTCVLAWTWRDVWKSTRRLRITAGAGAGTVQEARGFVDRVLGYRLHDSASLDECEIMFRIQHGGCDDDTFFSISHWIRTAIRCEVQTLRVLSLGELGAGNAGWEPWTRQVSPGNGSDRRHSNDAWEPFAKKTRLAHAHPDNPANFAMIYRLLVSPHLRMLELSGIWFECGSDLNLDGCPVLEHLKITNCLLLGLRICLSLKHLVITGCESNHDPEHCKISAPCLVSVWLEVGQLLPPLLESMPELTEAYVRIDSYWDNNCYCNDAMDCYHVTSPGYISFGDDNGNNEEDAGPNTEGCMLLEGLAQAKLLVLLAHPSTYIFRRDLRFCPIFFNLKTLVLNGYWCEPADCRALACILKHAPFLENLTVVFSEEIELNYDIVLEGCPDAKAKSTMTTQCLKAVKVKCHTVDEGVDNVLNFLSTLNICFNSE